MPPIRTFIAAIVPERVNRNLASVIARLAATGAKYNWVEESNLHLTLHFVGDLPDKEVGDFCREVKEIVTKQSAFDLVLRGIAGFPDPERPRVIWAGVETGSEALIELHRSLEPLLAHWGVNKDRHSYQPHMTLARLARNGSWNQPMLDLLHRLRNHDGGSCTIDKVIVFSSHLEKGGPIYTPMSTIRLPG